MNSKTDIRRIFFVLYLSFLVVGNLSLSGKNRDSNLKSWITGPLTWADYQVAEFGERANYSSITDFIYKSTTRKTKIGNYKFLYYSFHCYLNKDKTWYDPQKATEWNLRADQVVFDIMELHSRYIQNLSLGETTQNFQKIKEKYEEKAKTQVDQFIKESDGGRDSLVVRKYEESITGELDRNPRKEPDLSMAEHVDDTFGFYVSYDRGMFMGEASDNLKPSDGMSVGFDFFGRNNWYFDFGFSMQFTNLKVDKYYWDSKYNYDWELGKHTDIMRFYVNVGHTLNTNQYFRFIPYAGVGYSSHRQKTNSLNSKKDTYYLSNIDGIALQAGINADWMFKRTIRPDEVLNTSLRFRLYGALDRYSGARKNIWSINFGVAFHFDCKTYNTGFYYIPIIIF